MRTIPLTKGVVSIVDDDKYEELSKKKWHYSKKGYAVGNKNKKHIYMHRFIMNVADEKVQVDHINNIKTDNRVENLRLCNNRQNSCNTKISIKNKSGKKGVSWSKHAKKWRATIKYAYKPIHLGYFDNLDEASTIYNAKAKELFGEFFTN